VSKTLKRHSFSELLALAGELLHTPWRMSTFMTTDPLLPASSILKQGSSESALRHPRHVLGAPRIACTAYQYGPAESPGYSGPHSPKDVLASIQQRFISEERTPVRSSIRVLCTFCTATGVRRFLSSPPHQYHGPALLSSHVGSLKIG